MNVAAIILAAGESRRMGSPKALLPFRGGTFLSVLAGTLHAHCNLVLAVFGFDGQRLASGVAPPLVPVVNTNYRLGMLTSLQAGLRIVPPDFDAALFTLVDHPAVTSATVEKLVASDGEDCPIVIPRVGGKRGHPVLIRRSMIHEFLVEPATSKAHDVINRHENEIRYLDVEDRGVIDDIDDYSLYRDLLGRELAAAKSFQS